MTHSILQTPNQISILLSSDTSSTKLITTAISNAVSATTQISTAASQIINIPSKILNSIKPYTFVPGLMLHSTLSVVRLHYQNQFPASWDYRTSISVSLLKSGMEYRGNSSARIKLLQSLAITPVPSHITITAKEFTYSPSLVYNIEQKSRQNRAKTLPEIQPERSTSFVTVKLEFVTSTKNLYSHDRKFIMYLHGGAYFCGSLQTHRSIAYRLAEESNATVVMVSYRLSPEFAFPCALHDAFAAYLFLTQPSNEIFTSAPTSKIVNASDLILMGDSAGGGLSLALMIYLKDYINTVEIVVDMPKSGVLFSPWVDLSCSSESWLAEVNLDYLPTCPTNGYFFDLFDSEKGNPVMWYTAGYQENLVNGGEADSGVGLIDDTIDEEDAIKLVTHPLVSPYYANLSNLPPLLIQAGGVELIRDETLELVKMLHKANPKHASHFRHELYKDMPHVFQTFFWIDRSKEAIRRAGAWCKSIWNEDAPKTILFDDNENIKSIYGIDSILKKSPIVKYVEDLRLIDDLVRHPFF